jgi:transcriptional regulator with XRE-family HTH domain
MTETQIGTRIREARRARGLTQRQLAQRVDISVRMLRAYEQNQRTPDDKTLHKIADVLEFPAHYFLRGESEVKMNLMFVCRLDDFFGGSPTAG